MAGFVQSLSDIKLILTTDRRIWAGSAFVAVVVVVWLATGSWRESPPEKPEEIWRVKVQEERVEDMVQGFNKDLKEEKEETQYLKDSLKRANSELGAGKEEIEWHVNTLINKLNSMSEKVDLLTNRVGNAAIEKQKLEAKIARSKKKRGQGKKKVDGSEL